MSPVLAFLPYVLEREMSVRITLHRHVHYIGAALLLSLLLAGRDLAPTS